MDDHIEHAARQQVIAHLNRALALCDSVGLSACACHIQMGLDLLQRHAGPTPGQDDLSLRQ